MASRRDRPDRDGLRALAVTTAQRSAELPDVPTVGDTVKGYEASAWFGIGAPKNTPKDVIDIAPSCRLRPA